MKNIGGIFNKIVNISAILITFLIIFQIFSYFSQNISVHSEAMTCPYIFWGSKNGFVNEFFDVFLHSDHSWYLYSLVFSVSQKILPSILGLHPQNAIMVTSKIILFPIFLIFLFSVAMPLRIYSKDKSLLSWSICLILSLFTVLYALLKTSFLWVFYSDCWFFAYIFISIFALFFFSMAQSYYVLNKKPSKKAVVLMSVLFLCIAVSHEYFKFLFLIMIPLVYLLHHIRFRIKIAPKTLLKHSALYGLIACISLLNNVLGMYSFWFMSHFEERTSVFLNNTHIINFAKDYLNYVLLDNIVYIFIIVLLFAFMPSFEEDDGESSRFSIFINSSLFSCFLFFALLVVCEENYDGYLSTILLHQGLRFLIKTTFLMQIFSCLGFLFRKIKIPDKFSLIIVFLIAVISVGTFKAEFKTKNKEFLFNPQKQIKINSYILEKMFILNKKVNNDNIFYNYNGIIHPDKAVLYLVKNYGSEISPKDYQVKHVCDTKDNHLVCREKMIKTTFEKTGYKFTKDELEKLDFEALFKLNEIGD